MARAKKLWRPLRGWRPYEWVSFKKAWQRAEKVIWSNLGSCGVICAKSSWTDG
jgi:hypothetical protein